MDQMMKKGHAEEVSPDEESVVDFKSWYIRHHGVYHRKKPEKIRVVFGCLSEYKENPSTCTSYKALILRLS